MILEITTSLIAVRLAQSGDVHKAGKLFAHQAGIERDRA